MRSIALSLSLLLLACGSKPATSLLRLDSEPAGEMCAQGGVAVRTGLDKNHDQVLDDLEITDSAYVCHGASPIAHAEGEGKSENATKEPKGEAGGVESMSYETLMKRAPVLVEKGDFSTTMDMCMQALVLRPGDQQATMTCAIAACNLKDSKTAKRYIKRIQSATRRAGLKQVCMRLDVPGFGADKE
jgi:hypothetical protein